MRFGSWGLLRQAVFLSSLLDVATKAGGSLTTRAFTKRLFFFQTENPRVFWFHHAFVEEKRADRRGGRSEDGPDDYSCSISCFVFKISLYPSALLHFEPLAFAFRRRQWGTVAEGPISWLFSHRIGGHWPVSCHWGLGMLPRAVGLGAGVRCIFSGVGWRTDEAGEERGKWVLGYFLGAGSSSK